MEFVSLICNAIGILLGWLITIYCWVVFVGAILSLARADPTSTLVVIINRLTYPAYAAVKRVVKTEFNGLELAPLIVIVVAQFVNLTLVRFLVSV